MGHIIACGRVIRSCRCGLGTVTRIASAQPVFVAKSAGALSVNRSSNHRLFSSSRMVTGPFVNIDDVNKNVIKLQYAVRGPLVIRAGEIAKELQKVGCVLCFARFCA